MLDSKARAALAGLSGLLGNGAAALRLTPNVVTVLGVLVTASAAALIVADNLRWAGVVLIVGGVLDFVDGSLARVTGKSSRFGAFLDSVTDRMSDGMILAALALTFHYKDNRLGFWSAIISLLLAGLVPYARAKAEALGFSAQVGFAERAERVIAIIAGLIFGVVEYVLVAVAVASAVTLVQRLMHVSKQRER